MTGPSKTEPSGRGNRLSRSDSLYLRQHAGNPMDWYPWSEEALDLAKKEDRPVFLSIGYASCHWCHVMEKEVFEDEQVARFMNRHFVNVKVDREERPDLDSVYMEALLNMTGQGGWPMSLFLTPDLKPFFGGTYFPKDHFLALAGRIIEVFGENRDEIISAADAVYTRVSAEHDLKLSGVPGPGILSEMVERVIQQCDPVWGGVMARMKFVMPVLWRFLLHQYRKTGDLRLASVIRKTLDCVGSGGIQDHVGGGFHRYTVDREWVVPHFEKMLYDNAQLASLYIEAAAVFREPRYEEIARDTLDFMIQGMSGEKGGFYASLDADSPDGEGFYYIFSAKELVEAAGIDDGKALALLLGVTGTGNFEGKNVLTRRTHPEAVAENTGRDPEEIMGLFEKWRPALRDYRAKRTAPGLDRKIVTSWNGLALSAFSQGFNFFREERYLQAAERAAEFLLNIHQREEGGLYRVSNEGRPAEAAILDDYAFLAGGLLDLFEATQNIRYLKSALELIDFALSHFSRENGGFYLTPENHEAPLGRQMEMMDGVQPSGNSEMLHALLKAAAYRGDANLHTRVRESLDAFGSLVIQGGFEMMWMLDAALLYEGPFYEVVIAGTGEEMEGLSSVFRDFHPCHAVRIHIPGEGPTKEQEEMLSPVQGKNSINDQVSAYICRLGSCGLPCTDPEQFRDTLMQGWVV